MKKYMHEVILRCITSFFAGGAFFASYFCYPSLFFLVMLFIMLYILMVEWAPLVGGIRSWRFWMVSLCYPGIPYMSMLWLYKQFYTVNILLPLYPFLIAWVHDTASFCSGRLWGKHRIVPKISPKKTWEGLVGGIGGVILLNYLMRFSLPQVAFLTTLPMLLFFSLISTLIAFASDLFISWIKRRAGVKDTGALLPGHGGLLDRFDSVMFVALLVALVCYTR